MPLDERTLAAFEAFNAGKLSRRQFVARLAGLGFASGTIALFLAACSSGGAPAAPPAATSAPVAAAAPTRAILPTPAPVATQAAAPSTAAGAANDPGIMTSPDPNPK